MTTSTESSPGTDDVNETVTPSVVAAVLFVDEVSLPVSLESVRSQVYESQRLVVIGGGEAAVASAAKRDVEHFDSLDLLVAGLGPEIDYVWVIHGDARPRPDALGALVHETERNEASLVGSKILDANQTDLLESVGAATDVFGEPYSGLDPDEVDLEQYDVVRDVAFVSGVSMLVRRDLLRGLRGIDPSLPPVAAGMDLSQRARIAGGRVMVAPSSEVLHLRRCRSEDPPWREQAGRMRAMLKAYRWITLLWAIPAGWTIGLIDGIARLFLGQVRPLGDLAKASAWNIVRLPSTFAARNLVRAVRATGDEELFRYQVSGSVQLRALGTDLASRFGWFIDQEPRVVSEEEIDREISVAGPAGLLIAALVVGLGTRALVFGTAVGDGFWLPLHPEAGSVIRSYAGGWNPAGLGSTETIHPAAALVALVQWVLGGWAGALGLVTLLSVVGGVWGVGRLLSRLGIGGAAKWLAGIAYILGPFALLFTNDAYWPGYVALGPLPWMLDAVIDHPEGSGRITIGKVARVVLAAGLTAAFAPVAVVVPLVAVTLAIPIMTRSGVRPTALWWSLIALVAGADVVAPYLLGVPGTALTVDLLSADLWPSPVASIALLAATLLAATFGKTPNARVAGWGGAMVGLALLVVGLTDVTGELLVAAVALASLGVAFVVGGAIHVDLDAGGPAVTAQFLATGAALVVLALAAPAIPDGAAGMPDRGWSDRLDFVSELEGDSGADRVLLVGDPDDLPGEYRSGQGYAYRLVTGSRPTLDQAWLAAPRIGDRALDAVLLEVNRGIDARPGEMLGDFAVRWLVVSDAAPLTAVLTAQVDLAERQRLDGWTVYENLSYRPRVSASGDGWVAARASATGPASEVRVRVADNADPGWAPDWSQSEWANDLSGAEGRIWYEPDGLRSGLAIGSLVVLLVAAGLAFWGREHPDEAGEVSA
jgi:GT2 family glycosyltransferase